MTDPTKTEALMLADAIDKGDFSMRDLKAIAAEILRLSAECEALRADAVRYRWLRSNWFSMGSSYGNGRIKFETNIPRWSDKFSERDIDEAITAAMGGKESQGGNGSVQGDLL